MMWRHRLYVAAAAAALCGAGDAYCQERPLEPYELVRSLRVLQDRIAGGDSAAHLSYRTELSHLTELIGRARIEWWKDPRNVRATVALVLGGGDPHLLQLLLKKVDGLDRTLVRAALAYGENRNAEAIELLADVDARTLDPSIAGHIALVQAELLTKKDREKSLALLNEARLLAPGTMVEEAALRRLVALAVERDDADGFSAATTAYVRRFGKSVHMSNFRRQLAADVATRGMADEAPRRLKLETALEGLGSAERQDTYLSIAWEGLKGGSADTVRWAAANAARLFPEGSPQHLRSRLCLAAALIVGDQFDEGVAILEKFPTDGLDKQEAALLAASLRIAGQIRREPKAGEPGTTMPRGATEPHVAVSVRTAIAEVDKVLAGGRK